MASERQDFKPALDGVAAFRAAVCDEISGVAQLACVATDAAGCLVAFTSPSSDGSVWAAPSCAPRYLGAAPVADLISGWMASNGASPFIHQVSPSDAAVLRSIGIETHDYARFALARHTDGQSMTAAALLNAGADGAGKAHAEMVARGTSAMLAAHIQSERAAFWREQAGELRDNLVAARAQAAQSLRERAMEGSAMRRLMAGAQRGNLPAIAAALAKAGSFDGWLLIASDRDGFRVGAARGVSHQVAAKAAHAAARMIAGRKILARSFTRAPTCAEARLFRDSGYQASVRVLLDSAALILLARKPLAPEVSARVASSYGAIAPHLKSLQLTRELERQRALVLNLVRGLFATADAERAAFRRDLHDDFAQMLAAVQIAINGKPDAARRFFGRIRGELRDRLDALRPIPPRRGSLKQAAGADVQRLREAGIRATLSIQGQRRLPAAISEVFARVIGEGVSNVIRHAQANRVHIEVECGNGVAVAAITDDGRGAADNGAADGFGIRGLRERVALMGGRCELESTSGGTRLCARIPVALL